MYEIDPSFYGSFYDDLLMVFNGEEQQLRKEGRFPNEYVKELYYSCYDYDAYLLYNSDLKHLSEEEARNHWINQGLEADVIVTQTQQCSSLSICVNILSHYDDGCL